MISLYAPIISSVLFLFILLRVNFGNHELFVIERSGYKLTFTNNTIGRLVFFVLSLGFIPIYLSMDFSKLYPNELKMQVFFDEEGLQQSLSVYTKEELDNLNIFQDTSEAIEYYNELDKTRNRVSNQQSSFFSSGYDIFSEGRTSFVIEKLGGIHRYRVSEVNGSLVHTLERPNGKEEKFVTIFRKIPSAGDFISPTVRNVLVDGKIIIAPRFKQIITAYENPNGQEMNHTLTGLTTVFLWPIPSFGNTIYLYKNGKGQLIPVAYAIYY